MNKMTPQIRFQGFTDDWEERKLKYVASYRNGKAHEQVEDENGKFTIVNSKFISTDGKVKRNTNEQVEPMFKGELAIVLSDLPNGKALAKVFLVNENEKYTLNQRIAGITPKENCDSKFLSYRMNRHSYFLKFDSGVSQTNLSKPQVEEFVTLYPSFEEQQKIGSFFKQLDDTIALHQRMLDLLKEQKKGFLQKMFPKNGAKVPELRFSGFADDWEERNLGNIAGNLSDGDWIESNHIFDTGKYRIVQTGNIGIGSFLDKPQNAKYLHQADFDELKANEIFSGDILISRLSDPAGRTSILPDLGVPAVTAVDVAIIRPTDNFNSEFLVSELNSSAILSKVDSLASGSTRKRISRKNLEGVKISLPTFEEQQKIGSFFKQLDDTIALHQHMLDLLKEQKKGFLQKMFIS